MRSLLAVLSFLAASCLQGCSDSRTGEPTCSAYGSNDVGPVADVHDCRKACTWNGAQGMTSPNIFFREEDTINMDSDTTCNCLVGNVYETRKLCYDWPPPANSRPQQIVPPQQTADAVTGGGTRSGRLRNRDTGEPFCADYQKNGIGPISSAAECRRACAENGAEYPSSKVGKTSTKISFTVDDRQQQAGAIKGYSVCLCKEGSRGDGATMWLCRDAPTSAGLVDRYS